jgi:tetratricopeptide (TPR) repeat protein
MVLSSACNTLKSLRAVHPPNAIAFMAEFFAGKASGATVAAGGRILGLAALLCGAVFLAYLPALQGALIWNDRDYVTAPRLQSLAGLGAIWFKPGATEQYYPLLHSFFWVQHKLWGNAPLGYHIVTQLLHTGSAVLFALVLQRLAVPGAWLAAVLFALHPVHVQSVAWITEQKNTLSLVFYLAAALTYLRFDETRRGRIYTGATLLFLLSLLCKTVTATLPAALLVVLWWRRGRLEWRRDFRPLLPWLVLGTAAGIFTAWVEQEYVGARGERFDLPWLERILVAGRAFWFYLGQVVWPFRLNFVYPRWIPDAGIGWQWLHPLAALALTGVLWRLRHRSRVPLAVLLLFAGSLFPVLGFVNLYGALYSWVWDHWQYLPDLAPLALLAAALTLVRDRLPPGWRYLGSISIGLLVLGLGVLTWRHTATFRTEETLYRTTIAGNPAAWMAHNNLANLLAAQPGKETEAIAHYEEALRLRPAHADAHVNLGNLLARLPGRQAEARGHFEAALRLRPHHPETHNYFASLLATQQGFQADALAHYTTALRLNPYYAEAHNNLAGLLAGWSGRQTEAIAHYEQALRLKPDLAEAHNNFANLLATLPGRWAEAIDHYEQALRLNPAFPQAHNNLANLLSGQNGREPHAITHYNKALLLDPGYAEAHNNLGRVLASLPGRQDEALAHYEKAIALNPDFLDAHLNLAGLFSNLPGRTVESITHYDEALRIKPDQAQVHYILALLHMRENRRADALSHASRAVQLAPDNAEARQALAYLQGLPGK